MYELGSFFGLFFAHSKPILLSTVWQKPFQLHVDVWVAMLKMQSIKPALQWGSLLFVCFAKLKCSTHWDTFKTGPGTKSF